MITNMHDFVFYVELTAFAEDPDCRAPAKAKYLRPIHNLLSIARILVGSKSFVPRKESPRIQSHFG